jgi:uncharacterized protein (TIGR02001 family)
MKSYGLAAIVAASVLSGGAYAADLTKVAPPPAAPASTDGFDYAFGGKLQSDYISRGITQTDHQPGATTYGELRYNMGDTQFYAGTQIWSVKLPTDPAAEVDLYGGVRQTWGPVTVDVGGIYYEYPGNTIQYIVGGFPTTAANPSYYEIYAKPTWTVNDTFTLGATLYYSPNWTNVSADETYLSGTAKVNLPSNFSISGEFGHEFLGTSSNTYGPTTYVSYNTWNLGVSYVYKVFTFDVRYYGTDLSASNCWIDGSDPAGNVSGHSNWCGNRVMASVSADLTSKDLK